MATMTEAPAGVVRAVAQGATLQQALIAAAIDPKLVSLGVSLASCMHLPRTCHLALRSAPCHAPWQLLHDRPCTPGMRLHAQHVLQLMAAGAKPPNPSHHFLQAEVILCLADCVGEIGVRINRPSISNAGDHRATACLAHVEGLCTHTVPSLCPSSWKASGSPGVHIIPGVPQNWSATPRLLCRTPWTCSFDASCRLLVPRA